MAHAGRFTPRGRTTSRRRTSWVVGPGSSILTLSGAGATLWNVGAQSLQDGITIVRIRGEVFLEQVTATSVGDGFQAYTLGLCIVNENAFGIGVTAVPAPVTDISWDGWIWHHSGAAIDSLETTEVARGPGSAIRIPIDTKAMRKFKSTDVLIGVVEMGTEVGTANVQLTAASRVLVKLA